LFSLCPINSVVVVVVITAVVTATDIITGAVVITATAVEPVSSGRGVTSTRFQLSGVRYNGLGATGRQLVWLVPAGFGRDEGVLHDDGLLLTRS
jgi:hypothetical protein